MAHQDQSQMLDILLLVAVVDLDLLVLQPTSRWWWCWWIPSADGTPGTPTPVVVAGGGENGIGAGHGGGGGAGGFLQRFSRTIPVGTHPVTVGSGAASAKP